MRDAAFHAIIVEGAPGPRRALALRLAQEMVCRGAGPRPCGTCPQCRKVQEGIHPDVIPVERFMEGKDRHAPGAAIKVDAVRALRSDAFIRPNEAERKVYLLDGAERMNESAQNVLLKVVEEGPPYAAFLLLTDRVGSLLPTVRSRCVVRRSQSAPESAGEAPAPRSAELLSRIARRDGLELALFLAAQDKVSRPELEQLLQETQEALSQAVVAAAGGRTPTAEEQVLLKGWSSDRLLALIDWLRRAREDCDAQVGTGHILGALSGRLIQETRGGASSAREEPL